MSTLCYVYYRYSIKWMEMVTNQNSNYFILQPLDCLPIYGNTVIIQPFLYICTTINAAPPPPPRFLFIFFLHILRNTIIIALSLPIFDTDDVAIEILVPGIDINNTSNGSRNWKIQCWIGMYYEYKSSHQGFVNVYSWKWKLVQAFKHAMSDTHTW